MENKMNEIEAVMIENDEAYLRQISKPVNLNDPELQQDIDRLEKYCLENEVMAMAAVQLHIPKRLLYLKNTNLEIIEKKQMDSATEEENNYNEARVLINPVIIKKEGLTDYWEACVSCMDYTGHVERPYKIVIEYSDIKGNIHHEIFEGFESTVLSHEMDHLDGILHLDIALEVIKMTVEERKVFRRTHGYHITRKTGDFEKLKNND